MFMKRQALVLNQDYSPFTICSATKAFLLLYLKKAELVSVAEGKALRTVSSAYPMPSVVRLQRYVHLPYQGVVLTRQNIFRRDGFKCQYCGTSKDLTIDHVVPKSKRGRSTWKNMVTACKSCNSRKGDYFLEESGLLLRKRPYKPSFILFLKQHSGSVDEAWEPFLEMG